DDVSTIATLFKKPEEYNKAQKIKNKKSVCRGRINLACDI
ncbi:14184_t:CDS:1, partial [Entrophospora sp. SA101]